jgi:hypothetical protein
MKIARRMTTGARETVLGSLDGMTEGMIDGMTEGMIDASGPDLRVINRRNRNRAGHCIFGLA